jgi:hypothetical protein
MQSNDNGWQTMHSALGDAYMVLNKARMDDCKIPRNELERVIAGLETALRVKERNCGRFYKWDDAVHAFEQSVSPRWNNEWTREDWINCIKWIFATANVEGESNGKNS